jgi:hypothetical protein
MNTTTNVRRALLGPLLLALAAGCADETPEPVDAVESAICNGCEPPEPSPAPSPTPTVLKPNLKVSFDAVNCRPDSFSWRVTNVGAVAAGVFRVATKTNGWYSRFLQYPGLGVGESVTFTESYSYTTPNSFVVIADWNNENVNESNEYDNELGVQCLW